jgi:hypothetical protein
MSQPFHLTDAERIARLMATIQGECTRRKQGAFR